MNWYYAESGQQRGPVSDEELAALVQNGKITATTLVWREGLANWQPYEQVAAPAAPPLAPPAAGPAAGAAAPAPGMVACCECGNAFALDQVIRYGDRFVCATCKPVFLQRLSEGAALSSPTGAVINEQQLLQRDYQVDIGSSLQRAWNMFTANAGLIIGASLLLGLAFFGICLVGGMGMGLMAAASQGSIAGVMFGQFILIFVIMFAVGPVMGGYAWMFLRLLRGEQAGVGDAFAGFRARFWQLSLCYLVQWVIGFVASMICFLPVFLLTGSMQVLGPSQSAPTGFALMLMFIAYAVNLCISIYLTTIWIFSLLLIIDKGYKFLPAMNLSRKVVTKRWWMTFLFLFVAGIIAGLGVLACLVGLLVTVPLFDGMLVCLYNDHFRELEPRT